MKNKKFSLKNKDWLKTFCYVFEYMSYVFLSVMFLYSFVASLHYMAVSAGKITYAKQMFLFWGLMFGCYFTYVVLNHIKLIRNKKVSK